MLGGGVLSMLIWPTHIGVATDFGEPGTSNYYDRGTISWHPDHDPEHQGKLIGRARIHIPAGTYTHFIFYHAPIGGRHSSLLQMEHPYVAATDGVMDVWPIPEGICLV